MKSDISKTQLGLAHALSRAKVKFISSKADHMVIQVTNVMDILDKDIKRFILRFQNWYAWYFPELFSVVADLYQYMSIVLILKSNATVTKKLKALSAITGNTIKATRIIELSRITIGKSLSQIDYINIAELANQIIALSEYRYSLYCFLLSKMQMIAPNLSTLVGGVSGARLIAHSGSLINLAKYPSSTLQILGAEKSFFRALRTNANIPKHGIIYRSETIVKANIINKDRLSHYLSNKCSIAARIDAFMDDLTTNTFGKKLKQQFDKRFHFLENIP